MIYLISPVDVFAINGGAIVRKMTAYYMMQQGCQVTIIMPGTYVGKDYNVISTPLVKFSKLSYILECLGVIEDRSMDWVNDNYKTLREIVTSKDTVLATPGGEFSPIILGSRLKKETGCKLVINSHDPLDFTTLGGCLPRKVKFPHVNRDKVEYKYLSVADSIITNTNSYKDELQRKYPSLKNKIHSCYFGYAYPEPPRINALPHGKKLNIVYGGNFGVYQCPEILAQAVKGNDNVHLYYVGNHQVNRNLDEYRHESNITFLDLMPQEKYLQFLEEKIDVGFLSLKGSLASYCVPSKLYDFINLTIPIIGVVEGDASKIIEENGFGVTSDYSVEGVKKAIDKIVHPSIYEDCVKRLVEDHDMWSMQEKIKNILNIIDSIK